MRDCLSSAVKQFYDKKLKETEEKRMKQAYTGKSRRGCLVRKVAFSLFTLRTYFRTDEKFEKSEGESFHSSFTANFLSYWSKFCTFFCSNRAKLCSIAKQNAKSDYNTLRAIFSKTFVPFRSLPITTAYVFSGYFMARESTVIG